MFGATASMDCPEPSLVPPAEDHREDVECVWCRERAEPGDMTRFANGDVVCGDCLHDYLEAMGDSYYGEYAASRSDFIQWWARDYISLNCLLGILREAFEGFPLEYREGAQAEFAWASGQYFREYVEEKMGGVPLACVTLPPYQASSHDEFGKAKLAGLSAPWGDAGGVPLPPIEAGSEWDPYGEEYIDETV